MMDRNRSDLARDFMSAAADDLRAARVLLGDNTVRPTVYHLQQTAEKTTKAVLLALTDVDTQILRTHNSPRLVAEFLAWTLDRYGKLVELVIKLCYAAKRDEATHPRVFDLSAEKDKVEKLRRCADDRKNLRLHFPTFLQPCEQSDLDRLLEFVRFLANVDIEDRVSGALNELKKLGIRYEAFCDSDSIARTSQSMLGGSLQLPVLSMVGLILLHHDQDSRYPATADTGNWNWDRYTAESPLVMALPSRLPLMEGMHSDLSGYIDLVCGDLP